MNIMFILKYLITNIYETYKLIQSGPIAKLCTILKMEQ